MNVVDFKKKIYTTPWGHEFYTQPELDAFLDGIKYIKSTLNHHMDFIQEKSERSRKIDDKVPCI